MIPRASIVAWSATAPWPSEDQIEQDLIVSRLLVEVAADPLLFKELAFRGGTCLHKLHLEEPQRYSEDLDFVRTDQRPMLGEVFDRLRAITERIGLREHRRTFPSKGSDTATMWFDAEAESGATTIRVKIETNVAESTPHSNHVFIPFEVTSPWWSGSAEVRTFTIEEILATKVRALCQRRKGRDLFDLWVGLNLPEIDAEEITAALGHYMQDRVYRYPQLVGHLKTKLRDPDFAADLSGLVRSVPTNYDIADALDLVRRRIGLKLRNVPDDPTPIGNRGLTLEPPITPVSELHAERGWKPASEGDFERLTADDAPSDEEGARTLSGQLRGFRAVPPAAHKANLIARIEARPISLAR